MRLIELSANQASFRTVRFNPSGLTLIVGKKSDPGDTSREHSTNGVGKSLLLYLLSFCLGSAENKELQEKLPEWEFTLAFELRGRRYVVTRSTVKQKTVIVNGELESLKRYTDEILGSEAFGLNEPRLKFLTFRSLVGLFLRIGKPAYISVDQVARSEKSYAKLLRSTYLLGLDEQLADRKRELREEQERLKAIRSQFKKDSLLRDYFHGDRDVDLELNDLDEEVRNLEQQATDFRVAENYEQIATEAETTRKNWQRARNELNSLQSSLRQIESSLVEQPDVSADEVRAMYEAARVELPESIRKQLEEVNAFHLDLVESRARRLTGEKHRIERRIDVLTSAIEKLDRAKDDYYRFLGSHGALQEYEVLHGRLADLKRRADRLREFQQLERECHERSQKNKLEMSQENIRTSEYLNSAKSLVDGTNDRFRSMARRIWPNHTCGLIVRNNDGENLLRFDIDARIQGDASDGVSETKIFCFDMTVLLGQQNHQMKFVMHDNRLYQGIDPRQCAELFRIADEFTRERGFQYIATLNDANLEAIRNNMETPSDYDRLFTQNTVLELTDDSDAGKLLGITVDLMYDQPPKRGE